MSSALHESIFRSQPEEHAFVAADVEGTIPVGLTGTLLRSGPGLLEVGPDPLNFFDGHALIAGVSFAEGRATFRSRFVRSPLYLAETTKRAMQKRRIFTNLPARWSNLFALDFGNSAMHDVYPLGDRIVAGNDPGHFALDARTLETKGPETWGGAAAKGNEMGPMPYRDPVTGNVIGWVKKPGGARPDALKFVELDASGKLVKETAWHPLGGAPVLVHDQRATASWYVATEQAVRLSAPAAMWGARTVYDALQTPRGATATLLLVPRASGDRMLRIPLPAPYEIAFHVINAFDDGDRVIVDLVVYGGRIGFTAAAPPALREHVGVTQSHGPKPTPMRFVVDPAAGKIVETKALGELPGEAPEVSDARMGQRYQFAYFPSTRDGGRLPDSGGYFYYDALAKLDVETGKTSSWVSGGVVSPPAFVAAPSPTSEDDGWLVAYLLEKDGASLVVLDARAVEAGPVAKVKLGIHLPGVSHTRWAPSVQLSA